MTRPDRTWNQLFRLIDDILVEIAPRDGHLDCEVLGIQLRLNVDGLVMFDAKTHERLLTEAEAERTEKEAERKAKKAEQVARIAAEAKVRELMDEIARLKRGNGKDTR